MKASSQDLRQRILDTVQSGDGTLGQIARRFLVSVSFITRLLQRHRSTGSLEPGPQPHQSEEAIEAIEATGARVEPLPPWSPDLAPIEEMVLKLKGAMRSAAARTTNAIYWAFASALDRVTLNDIAGWFQSRAAYAMRL
jgi:hypothetical protein